MRAKRTIERQVSLAGVGIHSGRKVTLTLMPSSRGTIAFRRTDLNDIEMTVDPRMTEARNCTSLVFGECRVRTIEHLMAVLFIFGIDSLDVSLDGEEIPILDGSAGPLARAVLEAGVRQLQEGKKAIRILKPLMFREKGASLRVLPDDDFRVGYEIDFSHPAIGRQSLTLRLSRRVFLEEIAPARTFGFIKDVAGLHQQGLALGGSLENAVVLDEEKVINGPLRYPDEFVRHKILDLIGDLAVLGHPPFGRFQADRAGHNLHLTAVRSVLADSGVWAYEEHSFPSFLEE
jgi:UDP-3-O-[3-hydroxymyristoyl] N-acetylglucosamine deacetylase